MRLALHTISKDAEAAWAFLPPEFPSVTTRAIDPSVGDHDPDVLEIVRARSDADGNSNSYAVVSFDGERVVLEAPPPALATGELVLVYSDGLDQERAWVLGRVTRVEGRFVELTSEAIPATYEKKGPPFPWSGALVRVSVTRYFIATDPVCQPAFGEEPLRTLVRREDFERVDSLAYVDDFQVVYVMGTESSPKEVDDPPSISVPLEVDDVPTGLRIQLMGPVPALHSDGYLRKALSIDAAFPNLLATVGPRAQ